MYIGMLVHVLVIGVRLICLRGVYKIILLNLVTVIKKDADGITMNIIKSWYEIINAYDILYVINLDKFDVLILKILYPGVVLYVAGPVQRLVSWCMLFMFVLRGITRARLVLCWWRNRFRWVICMV